MRGSLQIKNGIYQAVFYGKSDSGKQGTIWRSTGIPATRGNKRKAELRLAEIRAEIEDKPISKDMYFVDYMDIWLSNVKNNVDTVTYEGYKSYVDKHIKPYFKRRNPTLQKVRLTDIEQYYNFKSTSGRLDGKEGGLSYRSIKLHSVVLNLMFNEAVRTSLIKDNPCRLAQIPKNAAKSEKKTDFYNTEQCKKLLEVTSGTTLHDMIYLTFVYGLRRSELMGLKWNAVDFDNDTITIQHTVVLQKVIVAKDSTKNKSSNRTYPLLDDVKQILLDIRNRQIEYKALFGNSYHDTGYVFTKANGETYFPSYPTNTLNKVLEINNLSHIRWHDLRHSCASVLVEKGWSMKDISDWLGHSDIGTTMNIYAHLDMEHKRNLSKELNGLLA